LAPAIVPAGQAAAEASARKALSLDAFPSAIGAFPASAGAFPVSLDAYAACAAQATVAQCHSQWRSDIAANPNPATLPSEILGYQPKDLQAAYDVASQAASQGGSQTIAVVVAYHDPDMQSALNTYRSTFGLAPCVETTSSGLVGGLLSTVTTVVTGSSTGCLTELWANGNANGKSEADTSSAPAFNEGWAIEEELDVEMVSAICPNCKIIVSESQDATLQNLAKAVTAAVSQHATEVSNSYTAPEASGLSQYDGAYQHNGVPMTAAAGDMGYGAGYPATVPTVTAVGGASLVNSAGTWGEAIWPGTGSGCSGFEKKPSWQSDTGCPYRTVNDLAVVGDPATGVAAFVSYAGGWTVFGGTSVGAPLVAGLYALAGNGAQIDDTSILYQHAGSFAPVTGRSNGTCYPNYLCAGGPGYDGPSGLGMPIGLTAF
jgi:subtilase family serine protease